MSKLRAVLSIVGAVARTIASAGEAPAMHTDAAITSRVKAALVANHATELERIDVETRDGVVRLSGLVAQEQAKRAAVAAARSVSDVREVRNEVIVRGREQGDRTAARVTDDTVIAARVRSELVSISGLETASDVDVQVRHGIVQLTGMVSSDDRKRQAEQIARTVAGVTEVRNSIEVQAPH